MKKVLFALLILFSYAAHAQSNYIGESDPNARALLKKVSAKYKAFHSISTGITLQVEDSKGQKLSTQKGNLSLKGNKYRLAMNEDLSFSDGRSIYNYDKAAGEIQITRINPKDNLLTPQKLFTNFYDKDYLYRLSDVVKSGSITLQPVELTPLDKTLPFFKVILNINKSTNQIVSAQIFEKSGTRYLYSLNGFRTNSSMPENLFTFNKSDFPGVEVIDLR
ncbi:MAG: outer membrane lipoprotein carrier protein LolA [Chitinophagaceae bacterium]|nr:outer membrane lipoprotein carrier protein LolA [Chitinophagaceae bacterium]